MRLNYRQQMPDALSAILGLERVANAGLPDPRLLDLVKIRASQINGCAFCARLHSGEATPDLVAAGVRTRGRPTQKK